MKISLWFSVLLMLLSASVTHAGSATWNLNPTSGDWNTPTNWSPNTVPNGSNDIATFGLSNVTDISISVHTEVNGIVFDNSASSFTMSTTPFGSTLVFTGVGITNNSGAEQTFALLPTFTGPGLIQFGGSATAGRRTSFVSNGVASGAAPEIDFMNSSNAGSGRFTNNGALASGLSGCLILFSENSTATRATITNNGATVAGVEGGITRFIDTSSAGNAKLIANGGSNGGDGGLVQFSDSADGGTARVKLFGNGTLDISTSGTPSFSLGSIEGDGIVNLGSNRLMVGTNDLGTTFAGTIQDGGIGGGRGGALVKIGHGNLTLTSANSYMGGTSIRSGTLFANNTEGSATGRRPVSVMGRGRLGGNGIIGGGVTLLGISNAIVAPGSEASSTGVLTIQRSISFNGYVAYEMQINSDDGSFDEIVAKGVTISASAMITPSDLGASALPIGMVLTIINNTSRAAISGTFSNLQDNTRIQIGGHNNFLVNYSGGDGNDLTLTVVP
jgi:autotransporter-associated beta strand protein